MAAAYREAPKVKGIFVTRPTTRSRRNTTAIHIYTENNVHRLYGAITSKGGVGPIEWHKTSAAEAGAIGVQQLGVPVVSKVGF